MRMGKFTIGEATNQSASVQSDQGYLLSGFTTSGPFTK